MKKYKNTNKKSNINSKFCCEQIKYKHITPHLVIDRVCQFYNILFENVASRSRSRTHVEPKQVSCFLIRKYVIRVVTYKDGYQGERKVAYDIIGSIFKRNHSTIMHSEKQAKNLIDTNFAFRKKIKILENQIAKDINFELSNMD